MKLGLGNRGYDHEVESGATVMRGCRLPCDACFEALQSSLHVQRVTRVVQLQRVGSSALPPIMEADRVLEGDFPLAPPFPRALDRL